MDRIRIKGHARLRGARGILLSLMIAAAGLIATSCESGANNADASGGVSLNGPLKVGVHYISFKDANGAAVATQAEVQTMLEKMSAVWAQCEVGFKLIRYDLMLPSTLKARYQPANYAELDSMREQVQTDRDLLIIGTGPWDRTGDLGNSGSNCYSSFPQDQADGIVCEQADAASSLIMSHEVGHWLNLLHTDDPTTDGVDDTTVYNVAHNLMNHFVAPSNNELTPGQCARVHAAISKWRKNAIYN